MIRKLPSGKYRLYSRKVNPKTGRRRNLGTFASRAAAEKHERAVQYFKRHKGLVSRMRCSVQRCFADPGSLGLGARDDPGSAAHHYALALRAALRPGNALVAAASRPAQHRRPLNNPAAIRSPFRRAAALGS